VSSLPPTNEVTMWVDKFTPKSSSDLCLAPKKVKEVRAWLEECTQQGSNSNCKLLILVGSPGIGKSATVRVLAKELHLSIMHWNESFVPRARGEAADRSVFSIEQSSPIDSFHEFLQQSGAGFSSLHLSNESESSSSSSCQKSVILLEDLPNLHGQDAELRFREVMSQHLRRSRVPTVLIFSDVSEGRHRPDDLERLIDRRELYSQAATTILQIHPVTKSKMKKVLDQIAKQQKCQVTQTFLEELHHQSRGDIRHAIMTLQLQSTGLKSLANSKISQNDRDVKLSTFHALGKLLYAKRTEKDGRSVLAFDPEEIMERSDLGIGGSLRFLEYHSTDFFSDIIELSDAYSLFSDAATLLDNPVEVSFCFSFRVFASIIPAPNL
jgi:cell cycle checkpoint protein